MNTQITPLRIFCGYASKDEALFKQLHTALAVPIRQEPINVWNYREFHQAQSGTVKLSIK